MSAGSFHRIRPSIRQPRGQTEAMHLEGRLFSAATPKVQVHDVLPSIAVVTPVKGRLAMIRRTARSVLSQAGLHEYLVVDYACPENTGDWVKKTFPQARVVCVSDSTWSLAKARNAGIRAVTAEWAVMLDADIVLYNGFIECLRRALQPGHFYIPKRRRNGMAGFLAAQTNDLRQIEGYDIRFTNYGREDDDIIRTLMKLGLTGIRIDDPIGIHIAHSANARTRYYPEKNCELSIRNMDVLLKDKWGIAGPVKTDRFAIIRLTLEPIPFAP